MVAILNNDQQIHAVRTMDFPTVIRRLDCSSFCRRTKFNGYVGGCHCGFTLFSRKRSDGTVFQSPPSPISMGKTLLGPSSMTIMDD
ncbi:hypothetical protein BLA29_012279, partial [Euroglyphus maynei]